jgi:hypothetical protein
MPPLSLPIHGIVYLQDIARVGLTTAQSAPADGFLTEHKRTSASVSTEIIGSNKRTVNGTMRAYIVSTKKKFSFQWDLVPADYAHTIDGQLVATSNVVYGMGGNDMLNFYETYYNKAIYLYVLNRATTKTGLTQANINTDLATANTAGERYKVLIKDFTYDVKNRNVKMAAGLTATDLWNVSMSFEEV